MLLRRFAFVILACLALGPPVFSQSKAGPFVISSSTSKCATIGTQGQATVFIDVTGTFSITLNPEVAIEGGAARGAQVFPTNSSTAQTTITAAGGYYAPVGSADEFLVCVGSYVSGSATILLTATPAVNASILSGGGGGGGSMVYPGAGIPNSTGSAWGTSYTSFGSEAGVATSADPGTTAEVPMVADGTHGQKPSASGALGTGAFQAAPIITAVTSPLAVSGGTETFAASLLNYSGNGNGSSDNSTAMTAACAANSEVWLPAGAFAFTSNYALPCPLHFGTGATLVAPTGVTVSGLVVGSAPPNVKILTVAGTGKFTHGAGQTVNYAEWWGVTGTADYTPITKALAALVDGGTTQLLCKSYTITGGTVVFANSYTTLNGCGYGPHLTVFSTVLTSATATGDLVDMVGTGANCGAGQLTAPNLTNLSVIRTVAPTAGYGVNLTDSCWARIENVELNDAGLSAEYHNGTGNFYGNHVEIYYSLSTSAQLNGVDLDSSTVSNNGTALDNYEVAGPGLHVKGFYAHGSLISDIWTKAFQIDAPDYCFYIDGTSAGGAHAASDIHLLDSICDSAGVSEILVTGVANTANGMVEINGGEVVGTGSGPTIDIESSNGVSVSNMQFRWYGAGATQAGLYINGGGGNAVNGNIFNGGTTSGNPILLNATADNAIVGNTIWQKSSATTTMIALTGATYNAITGNSLYGYATDGITADGSSNYNKIYPNVIDPTHITTPYTDAGTGNVFAPTVTYGNCAAAGSGANPSIAACGANPSGAFSCATNASTGTCQVNTSVVTANSRIFVQPSVGEGSNLSVTCNASADTGLTAPRLLSKNASTSFTINLGTFTANPLCFDYFIVN
jgi:hypothetical protein